MTIKYAVVTEVTASSYKVRFLGESQPSNNLYHRLESYIPVVGDKVGFIEDDLGKLLNLGKVV